MWKEVQTVSVTNLNLEMIRLLLEVTDCDMKQSDLDQYEKLTIEINRSAAIEELTDMIVPLETEIERQLQTLLREKDSLSIYTALYYFIKSLMEQFKGISRLADMDPEFPKLYSNSKQAKQKITRLRRSLQTYELKSNNKEILRPRLFALEVQDYEESIDN
ncbi:hypothetical protein FGO68_gene10852 [Halteria grandinella]|uniref:Uncharacterized protein n=1 Tax=Halteria grandinella TaxID=5974 RepID=A0A8J8P765_HALGN|nr:hypothetical protein FGO68_gene10852 [Halteria grandinella]